MVKKRTFLRFKKRLSRSQNWFLAGSIVILVGIMIVESRGIASVDPRAYQPLLSVIAKGESGGNYNAYFGNPGNTEVRFTDMTLQQVLSWQEDHQNKGNVSNAVGKYQIIQPTLNGLIATLSLKLDEKFDENLQDRLAVKLLEQRGAHDYLMKKISREDFAANISMEWAALPKLKGDNPESSYYAGDGLNRSHISVGEVLGALDSVEEAAKKYDAR